MFDGAAVATAGAVSSDQLAQDQAGSAASAEDANTADTLLSAPTGEPQFTTEEQALFDALAAYDANEARQEVVFVSSSVLDYQQLLDDISPNVEVHILDSTRDGVQQMAEVLAGRTGIDAIHLMTRGKRDRCTRGQLCRNPAHRAGSARNAAGDRATMSGRALCEFLQSRERNL